jgi:hypothetical protein
MAVKNIRTRNKTKNPIKKRTRKTNLHDDLCYVGGKWLKRHENNRHIYNCSTVAIELSTIEREKPDIIGWNSSHSILIEVKTSRNDFFRDRKKEFRIHPEKGVGEYRYYLCNENLINKDELPEKWGLLYVNKKNKISVIKVANKQKTNMIAERNILLSISRRIKSKDFETKNVKYRILI